MKNTIKIFSAIIWSLMFVPSCTTKEDSRANNQISKIDTEILVKEIKSRLPNWPNSAIQFSPFDINGDNTEEIVVIHLTPKMSCLRILNSSLTHTESTTDSVVAPVWICNEEENGWRKLVVGQQTLVRQPPILREIWWENHLEPKEGVYNEGYQVFSEYGREVKREEIDEESWTLLIPEDAKKYPLE